MKVAVQIVISFMFLLYAVTVALPRLKRQTQGYVLPAGADLLFSQVRSTFTCDNREYGYYADVDNECHIFHVCVPKEGFGSTTVDPNNQKDAQPSKKTPYQFSFFCPNQTVFSQADFVCMFPDEAAPCEDSENLYNLNERFGQTDTPAQQHNTPIDAEARHNTHAEVAAPHNTDTDAEAEDQQGPEQ